MKTVCLSLIACAAAALLVPAATAQQPPKPGPEHEHLKRLEGTWEATIKMGDQESKGTMKYKMGLGGLWLISDLDGEFGGMKFSGKGLDTYDPSAKKYRTIWADSMSTAPMIMQGTFDKDSKTMTMTGEGPGQDGKTAKFKTTTEIKDSDTMLFSLYAVGEGGKDQPMIKITYKRKK